MALWPVPPTAVPPATVPPSQSPIQRGWLCGRRTPVPKRTGVRRSLNPLSSGDGFVAVTGKLTGREWEPCLNPLSSGDGFVARRQSGSCRCHGRRRLNPLSSGDGFVANVFHWRWKMSRAKVSIPYPAGMALWPSITLPVQTGCFCQSKREPLDGRKGNHFGLWLRTPMIEKGTT